MHARGEVVIFDIFVMLLVAKIFYSRNILLIFCFAAIKDQISICCHIRV